MNRSDQKGEGKKKVNKIKTFPVPFALGEIKTNITINTNTPSKPSKEQIINQAFKFHSQGNISEAANSPLGLYLDIDFELRQTVIKPSRDWFRLHPDKNVDITLLQQESNIYNNLIEQYDMILEVIKKEI